MNAMKFQIDVLLQAPIWFPLTSVRHKNEYADTWNIVAVWLFSVWAQMDLKSHTDNLSEYQMSAYRISQCMEINGNSNITKTQQHSLQNGWLLLKVHCECLVLSQLKHAKPLVSSQHFDFIVIVSFQIQQSKEPAQQNCYCYPLHLLYFFHSLICAKHAISYETCIFYAVSVISDIKSHCSTQSICPARRFSWCFM